MTILSASSASLTALCSTLHGRILAAEIEVTDCLGRLQADSDHAARLGILITNLKATNQNLVKLNEHFDANLVASESLRVTISQHLSSCDAQAGVIAKQLMRLSTETLHYVDWAVLDLYFELFRASSSLFAHLSQLLSFRKQDEFTQTLEFRGTTQNFEHLLDAVSSHPNLLQPNAPGVDHTSTKRSSNRRQSERGGPDPNNAPPPPPYELAPSQATSEFQQPTPPPDNEGSSSSTRWDFSSFSKSFQAITSSLRPKPDPLVSALCQAISRGDLDQTKGLLGQGANMDGRDEDGNTPLQCAIAADQIPIVDLLLASGTDVRGAKGSGMPAVFYAASVGRVDLAQLFIRRGADVNQKSVSGQPYFVDVSAKQNVNGVRILLENGADPNSKSVSGQPVLIQAIRAGNVELTSLLISHGANPSAKDITGSSSIAIAMDKKGSGLQELLLEAGANPNSKTIHGSPVLTNAISLRDFDFARLLLSRGANGDASDHTGQRAITKIIRDNKLSDAFKLDFVKNLLQHGANPRSNESSSGHSVLWYAIDQRNRDLVRLLLQHGASATSKHDGETILVKAIATHDYDTVGELLAHGADPNAKDSQKQCPLMLAIVRRDLALIQLLRRHGATQIMPGVTITSELVRALTQPEVGKALGLHQGS